MPTEIPKIETWEPAPEDVILTTQKNIIRMPVCKILGLQSDTLDIFIIRPKKCYNSQVLREHICHVINYFEKFYDFDRELLINVSQIKFKIDAAVNYSRDDFINEVRVYVLNPSIKAKVQKLATDNYNMELKYKNIQPSLQYNDHHATVLMEMSILMNFVIPLITHYAQIHRVNLIDDFILDVFDYILSGFDVDIFSKLIETAYSNVRKSENKNAALWAKQDIRGKDRITHSRDSVDNIILNIMPKYSFDRNIVALNYTSIQKNTGCQITDISYEYSFVSLSSSKREGEDASSEFDQYESGVILQNEGLSAQAKINCKLTMEMINRKYGPFDQKEIDFYKERLKTETGIMINRFQRELIYNIFYKMFGDTVSPRFLDNGNHYIQLMLAAKRILLQNGMIIMPYVVSSKVEKLVTRKTISKKEEAEFTSLPTYPLLIKKYRSEKVMMSILSKIATVISSNFRIIDYNNHDIDGRMIDTYPSVVMAEMQQMALLY